ncbi:hypothetical protein [Bacillus sp. 7884-1]|uniref:hypothetical protein n=1 Tax=Bacillus sp. 7884-1 TaxID=2021693 RepID=UPI00211BD1FD|nr:hypothetical protein [Bacillus sp. 7884-1]
MAKRMESMSIKEFLNREERQQPAGNKIKRIVTTSVLPLAALTPTIAFAAEAGRVERYVNGELYERVVHAFEPVIGLVQALSYPIGLVVMLGGGLFVMIGNREKGFDMIAKAGIGYILVQSLPMLMDLLVEIAQAI